MVPTMIISRSLGAMPAIFKRRDRGLRGHVAGRLARSRHVARPDAGALADPLVARVDAELGHELLVGDAALGKIGAGPDDASNVAWRLPTPKGPCAVCPNSGRRELAEQLFAALRRLRQMLEDVLLLRERLRLGERVQDGAMGGAAVRDHGHAVDARRAARRRSLRNLPPSLRAPGPAYQERAGFRPHGAQISRLRTDQRPRPLPPPS